MARRVRLHQAAHLLPRTSHRAGRVIIEVRKHVRGRFNLLMQRLPERDREVHTMECRTRNNFQQSTARRVLNICCVDAIETITCVLKSEQTTNIQADRQTGRPMHIFNHITTKCLERQTWGHMRRACAHCNQCRMTN